MATFSVTVSFMKSAKMSDFVTDVDATTKEDAITQGIKIAKSFGFNGAVNVSKTKAREKLG